MNKCRALGTFLRSFLGGAHHFARFDAGSTHIESLGGFANQSANALDIRIPATIGLTL